MTIEVKNFLPSNPKTEIKKKLPKFLVRLPRLSHLNKRLKANHEKPRIISLFFLFAIICYAWSIANRTDICTYKIIIYTVWGFVTCYLNIKNEALNFMKWCPGKRVAFVFAIPIQSELWTTGMGVKVRWPYTVHRQSVGLFCGPLALLCPPPVRSVKTQAMPSKAKLIYIYIITQWEPAD